MAGTVHESPLVNQLVVGVAYDEPTKASATGATAGSPGVWTPAGCEVPETTGELSGVTASPATVWGVGEYVVAADGNEVYWTGTAWAAGRAPAPPPPGGEVAYDPADYTVEDVKAYVEDHPDEAAAVLDAERAGSDRSTLVSWLEAQTA